MTGVTNVYSLGKNGVFGFFVIHKGFLVYTDPDKDPQIEIPIRILQDVIVQSSRPEENISNMKIVFNFEVGFEIDLPSPVAEKAKIWILSILGMSNSAYRAIEREDHKESPSQKKPSRIYTVLTFLFIIGFVIAGAIFFFKPVLLTSVQSNFVKQDPFLALDYQKKGIEEEKKGHITSAISFFETALGYHPKNPTIREDLDRVLEKRIEQNIRVGNFVRAKQDLHKLSKENQNRKIYADKLKEASKNHTIKLVDVTEIVRLLFKSAFSDDPLVQQELNDKLQLFGQKLEFVLQ
jgi:tetratricopeptide (TPR) repeat protein